MEIWSAKTGGSATKRFSCINNFKLFFHILYFIFHINLRIIGYTGELRNNQVQSRYSQRSLILINVKENSVGKICSFRLYIIVYMICDNLFFYMG